MLLCDNVVYTLYETRFIVSLTSNIADITRLCFPFLHLPLQVNEWNKNDERLLAAVEHGEVEKVASLLSKKGASAVKLDGEGKSAYVLL